MTNKPFPFLTFLQEVAGEHDDALAPVAEAALEQYFDPERPIEHNVVEALSTFLDVGGSSVPDKEAIIDLARRESDYVLYLSYRCLHEPDAKMLRLHGFEPECIAFAKKAALGSVVHGPITPDEAAILGDRAEPDPDGSYVVWRNHRTGEIRAIFLDCDKWRGEWYANVFGLPFENWHVSGNS